MTTPFFNRFPYGNQLTIVDTQESLILSQTNGKFWPDNNSDSNLAFIGWERKIFDQDNLELVSKLNTLSEGYFEGPFGEEVYHFQVRLKELTSDEMETLIAMHKRQLKTKENILLIDELLITEEATPRTRAKTGTINPTGSPGKAGMVYFWGQYYIRINAKREFFIYQYTNDSGDDIWYTPNPIDMFSLGKVPTSEDIA